MVQGIYRATPCRFYCVGTGLQGRCDISKKGFFIRTNMVFAPDSIIDIALHRPDGLRTKLKGKVKRAEKTSVIVVKNGMRIELIKGDNNFRRFIKSEFNE